MRGAQLGSATDEIAGRLFGCDAYEDAYVENPMIKAELNSFVNTVLAYIWNQTRKSVKSQHRRLQIGKEEVKQEFERM